MTEFRAVARVAELESDLRIARNRCEIVEDANTKLRAIVASYEESTRRDRARVEELLAKVRELETIMGGQP